MKLGCSALVVVCLAAPHSAAMAEPPRETPPAQNPASAETPGVLSGPQVTEAKRADSIVEYDFDGAVRRPESTPEETAAAKLGLEGEVKESVRKVFERRMTIIDDFVSGNIDLLTKLGNAAGNKKDQAVLLLEAAQKLSPLREGGTLWDQVAATLPRDKAARFDTMLKEYWDAIVAEGKRTKNDEGKLKNRFEVVAGERLAVLGREIQQSFERQLKAGTLFIKAITSDLALSQAQKDRIRDITLAYGARTGMDPTEKQRELLIVEILSVLDEKQREAVAKKFGT